MRQPTSPPRPPLRALDRIAGTRLRRTWDRRADTWGDEGSQGLTTVVQTVLDLSKVRPGSIAVDLGCGTGQLSRPLARMGAHVTAVDISPAMVDRLVAETHETGESVVGVVAPIERFEAVAGSVDLVVSNYALHHLRDRAKGEVVATAMRWLRPGGRLVIGDMMFGRGSTPRDRTIIRSKVATLAKRGPAGWWRIGKNVVRFAFRLGERPVTAETWQRFFREAGFEDVTVQPVVAEAVVVAGQKR